MKKTYLAPEIVMTEIETEQVVCGSGDGLMMKSGPANGNDAMGNDRDSYDDDDEDLW